MVEALESMTQDVGESKVEEREELHRPLTPLEEKADATEELIIF